MRFLELKIVILLKKALRGLKKKKISYEFLDVKKSVLNVSLLETWMENIPEPYTWENLINKSGMTWRNFLILKKI